MLPALFALLALLALRALRALRRMGTPNFLSFAAPPLLLISLLLEHSGALSNRYGIECFTLESSVATVSALVF